MATAGPGPSATVSQRQGPGWFTFITGVVYGLQPDALFVIVPALALPTKAAAAAYILMFVIGTVTAMGGYTAVIGALPPHPIPPTCLTVSCVVLLLLQGPPCLLVHYVIWEHCQSTSKVQA